MSKALVMMFLFLVSLISHAATDDHRLVAAVREKYEPFLLQIKGWNSISASGSCKETFKTKGSACVTVGFETKSSLRKAIEVFGKVFEVDGVEFVFYYEGPIVPESGS
jgi:hypothetical protein